MITLSSTESEMCAMSEGETYARWLTSMLRDLGYPLDAPIRMYMDNLSAIHLLTNDGAFARNKHIIIRENYAKEAISDGTITVHHKRTNEMSADMLTKFRTGQGLKSNMRDAGMVYIESGGKDKINSIRPIAAGNRDRSTEKSAQSRSVNAVSAPSPQLQVSERSEAWRPPLPIELPPPLPPTLPIRLRR